MAVFGLAVMVDLVGYRAELVVVDAQSDGQNAGESVGPAGELCRSDGEECYSGRCA